MIGFMEITMDEFNEDTQYMTHFRSEDGAQALLKLKRRGCGMMGDLYHILVQVPKDQEKASYYYVSADHTTADGWFAEHGFVRREECE